MHPASVLVENAVGVGFEFSKVTTFGCSEAMSDTLVDPEAGEPGRMRQRRVTTTSFQDVSCQVQARWDQDLHAIEESIRLMLGNRLQEAEDGETRVTRYAAAFKSIKFGLRLMVMNDRGFIMQFARHCCKRTFWQLPLKMSQSGTSVLMQATMTCEARAHRFYKFLFLTIVLA